MTDFANVTAFIYQILMTESQCWQNAFPDSASLQAFACEG